MNKQGGDGIHWTDYTWNVMTGCSKVSTGCQHCFAERIAHRFAGTKPYPNGFGVTLHPERLAEPVKSKAKKGTKVFVCDMGDPFHEDVPTLYLDSVFQVIQNNPRFVFQVLTKRSARMRQYMLDAGKNPKKFHPFPIPNLWLGVSVENQTTADERIPDLMAAPAAVRFISAEPLLAAVDFITPSAQAGHGFPDWIIAGGESGPGARPADLLWFQSLRGQCLVNDIPFFFKQAGGRGKDKGGNLLDGRTWEQFPKGEGR